MNAVNELAIQLTIDHRLGKFLSVQPISGGSVNQVYLFETDSQKLILRLNNQEEYARFKKEEWAARAAANNGVQVPHILHVGNNDTYAYTVMSYILGQNGKAIDSNPDIWRKLGASLQHIHTVPVSGFGEELANILKGAPSEWQRYLKYNIESLDADDVLVAKGILDTGTSQKLRTVFEGLLATDFKFGLNHGDYSLSNVIVDEQATPYIIDWGSAQAHEVPHHDLGVIVDESLDDVSDEFHSLLIGYGMSQEGYMAIRSDIANLYLLEMADMLRWAFDRSPVSIPEYTKQLHKYLDRL